MKVKLCDASLRRRHGLNENFKAGVENSALYTVLIKSHSKGTPEENRVAFSVFRMQAVLGPNLSRGESERKFQTAQKKKEKKKRRLRTWDLGSEGKNNTGGRIHQPRGNRTEITQGCFRKKWALHGTLCNFRKLCPHFFFSICWRFRGTAADAFSPLLMTSLKSKALTVLSLKWPHP